jgi:hypothetical protein
VALPLDELREEFVPRFLTTDSYEEFIAAMARFVRHVKRGWLRTGVEWPDEHAEGEAKRLLEESVGVQEAMTAVRHGDRGGLRRVLDEVTRRLQEEALPQWVESTILPQVLSLSAEKSVEFAEAYLERFDTGSVAVESPEIVASRWREVLLEHALMIMSA